MYLYSCGPIDYFAAFTPADEFLARVLSDDKGSTNAPEQEYIDFCVRALESDTLYEADDHARGPFVSALPDNDYTNPLLIVSVKGSNNGTYYVASPVELPWLGDYLTAEVDGPRHPNYRGESEGW